MDVVVGMNLVVDRHGRGVIEGGRLPQRWFSVWCPTAGCRNAPPVRCYGPPGEIFYCAACDTLMRSADDV